MTCQACRLEKENQRPIPNRYHECKRGKAEEDHYLSSFDYWEDISRDANKAACRMDPGFL